MKALVITCYESNEERVNCVIETFRKINVEVKAISTNFLHKIKEKRTTYSKDYTYIPTIKYYRNMSLMRLVSHAQFASDAFILTKDYNPDIIWLIAPCNSLIKQANKYKKKNKDVKIIIDMIDMWPESLPISFNKNIFPFSIWKNVRTENIKCADYLVTECDLYQEILKKEYNGKIATIYWARNFNAVHSVLDLPKDEIGLCYIGSINNIIDIDKICSIIKSIDKKVVLHIIGVGEKKDKLVQEANKICRVIDYGETYDSKIKEDVLSKCHAGLNIYKDNLYIGLTVKSIDYFQHGLPIINNIKGDTWDIIDKNKIGINVSNDTIIKSNDIIELRNNSINIYKYYEENFTKRVFIDKCLMVINEVIG